MAAAATGHSGRSGRLSRPPNAPAGPDLTMVRGGRGRPRSAGPGSPEGGESRMREGRPVPPGGPAPSGPRRIRGPEQRRVPPERDGAPGQGSAPTAEAVPPLAGRRPAQPPRRAHLCRPRHRAPAVDAARLRSSRCRRPRSPAPGRTAAALEKCPRCPRRTATCVQPADGRCAQQPVWPRPRSERRSPPAPSCRPAARPPRGKRTVGPSCPVLWLCDLP